MQNVEFRLDKKKVDKEREMFMKFVPKAYILP